MKDISLRSAEQLGAALRLKRKEQRLSQAALAERLGVGRKWIISLEAGNPRAEIGLLLRALATLGLQALLIDPGSSKHRAPAAAPLSAIDEVFQRLGKRERK
jgi:HTH-type transcriptional regulator/antitoxin HipB